MTDRFVTLHEIDVNTDGTVFDYKTTLVNTSAISSVEVFPLEDGSWVLSVHCSEGGEPWRFSARAVDPYGKKLPEVHDHDSDDVLEYAMRYLNGDC